MTVFVVAMCSAVVLTGLLIPVLRRAGWLDVPNSRSSHSVPTPKAGGLAVLAAVVLGVAVSGEAGAWPLLVPALLLGLVGLTDDLKQLSPATRLVAQVLAATGLVLWVAAEYGSDGLWAPLFAVIGVLGLVAYVNAFNFMDGIDTISSLNGAVAGAWFVWIGHDHGLPVVVVVGAALGGAALGFLPWNAGSRVFLGDVGSYGMGALAAGAAVVAWAAGVPGLVAVAPLLIYLADTGSVLARRAMAGESLTAPHRTHVYQRLVQSGWRQLASAAWSASLAGLLCVVVATLYDDTPAGAVVIVGLLITVYLLSPRLVNNRHRPDAVAS